MKRQFINYHTLEEIYPPQNVRAHFIECVESLNYEIPLVLEDRKFFYRHHEQVNEAILRIWISWGRYEMEWRNENNG